MGIFKYLRKVIENKADVYDYENRTLREAGNTFVIFLICVSLLAFQPLRVFLKWLAYLSIGTCAVFMFFFCLASLKEIRKSFRYAKKLEKLGSSVEEEALSRRTLCEIEGDEGVPPEEN